MSLHAYRAPTSQHIPRLTPLNNTYQALHHNATHTMLLHTEEYTKHNGEKEKINMVMKEGNPGTYLLHEDR